MLEEKNPKLMCLVCAFGISGVYWMCVDIYIVDSLHLDVYRRRKWVWNIYELKLIIIYA